MHSAHALRSRRRLRSSLLISCTNLTEIVRCVAKPAIMLTTGGCCNQRHHGRDQCRHESWLVMVNQRFWQSDAPCTRHCHPPCQQAYESAALARCPANLLPAWPGGGKTYSGSNVKLLAGLATLSASASQFTGPRPYGPSHVHASRQGNLSILRLWQRPADDELHIGQSKVQDEREPIACGWKKAPMA